MTQGLYTQRRELDLNNEYCRARGQVEKYVSRADNLRLHQPAMLQSIVRLAVPSTVKCGQARTRWDHVSQSKEHVSTVRFQIDSVLVRLLVSCKELHAEFVCNINPILLSRWLIFKTYFFRYWIKWNNTLNPCLLETPEVADLQSIGWCRKSP